MPPVDLLCREHQRGGLPISSRRNKPWGLRPLSPTMGAAPPLPRFFGPSALVLKRRTGLFSPPGA
ncbi:hypothetical protein STRAU_4567 [Streptomyces aurantiacus JA 4570]|uniref:Uncharacterized protein n=1 Tax=Streptomyces aurantiacus JA 4570 TaxID=1286094 RepID=S4ALS8_9ACTN|nr:hypothetical protein STRAU_4567 [Streptomyces aurantiacus JA 4570]